VDSFLKGAAIDRQPEK